MRSVWLSVSALATIIVVSCSKESPVAPYEAPLPSVTYTVSVPDGKLPWPQHDPSFSQAQYDDMMSNLFIINNFGQYQGGNTVESVYFHDGLDVVLPNGTKIYAVDSGYVEAIINGGEYYQTLIIGDVKGDVTGYGWAYTHVNNFQVKVGTFVPRGTYIADIHFQGVPHVHLGRAYLSSGSWQNSWDVAYVQPDKYFTYADDEIPVFDHPFYYFRNNTDSLFALGSATNHPIVSGDVDIVVGIREAGEYAHAKEASPALSVPEGFGDRLCISRIQYEISGERIEPYRRKSFDFSKILLKSSTDGYRRVYAVYKFYNTIHPEGTINYDKIFSYYVITNTDGTGEFGEIKVTDQNYAWNTSAKDENGNPQFPNGLYTIDVTAFDFMGNAAGESEVVQVEN
jgi:hypothetical protein